MQNFSTIIGVIELRQNGCGFRAIQRRYSIGAGTVDLILKRFQEIGLSLSEAAASRPQCRASIFPGTVHQNRQCGVV